jgi:outer membrane protein assembly factor BamB
VSHSLSARLSAGFALLVLSAATLPAQQAKLEWPQFRGPNGQGVSADKAVPLKWGPKENLLWKTELPSGTSSPIVVGPHVFLTASSGYDSSGRSGTMDQLKLHLLCVSLDSGKVLWTKDVAPKLPEQATIRETHGYASGTPAADAERLYVSYGKSGVLAFDHKGNELWRADIGSGLNGWGSAASPMLAGDLVIVNAAVESESLIALNKKTGKEVWRAKGIKESWNTPILAKTADGKTELVLAIMGKVLGFDPASGKQLWSCATDIGWYMVPSLVADGGVVYCIGGRSGGGLAVRLGGSGDVTKSHRVWTSRKGSNVTSPILHEGHLYWMHEATGVAYCAEAKTGNMVYEERVPGAQQVYASPVLADGRIYYIARNGRTFVVAAKPKYELLAANDLGEPRGTFNASPAVAGGRLLVRSEKHLYCVGGK